MPRRLPNGSASRPSADGTEIVPAPRDMLSLISLDGREIVATVDGWAALIGRLPTLAEGVYEVRRPGGPQLAAATTDGHGSWHIWGQRSVR